MSIPEPPIQRSFSLTRSPLVWLGLFGLLFILWSWQDSMHRMAGFGRLVEIREVHPLKDPHPPWKPKYMAFYGHSGGCLKANVAIPNSTPPLHIETLKYEAWNSPYVPPDARWFPMPEIQREEPWPFPSGASYVGTTFLLPHWISIIVYLAIWAGMIAWRWRRVRRAVIESQRAST